MRVTFIVFLALVVGHATGDNIFFNTDVVGCEGPQGCDWNDPSIWIGGIVPSHDTDSVYLNDTRPNIYVIYNNNSINININSLFVSGVTLEIRNSSIAIGNLVVENASLSLEQTSLVYSYENIIITNNANITLLSASTLVLLESAPQFALDQTSYLYVGPGSTLQFVYGVLEMDASSTFVGGSVVFGRTISLSNAPNLQSAIFKRAANGTFSNGLITNSINLDPGSFVTIYRSLGAVNNVDIQDGAALYLRSIYNTGAGISSFSQFTGTLVIS